MTHLYEILFVEQYTFCLSNSDFRKSWCSEIHILSKRVITLLHVFSTFCVHFAKSLVSDVSTNIYKVIVSFVEVVAERVTLCLMAYMIITPTLLITGHAAGSAVG